MKVNQNFRLRNDPVYNETKVQVKGSQQFQEFVKFNQNQLQMEQLQTLYTEIEKAGERLAKSRNFRDLAKYKNLVQRFLKEVTDFGIGLKKSHSSDPFGQSRMLQIIEKVDEKLIELTDELIKQEEENILILGKLGEIKGLIINLFT